MADIRYVVTDSDPDSDAPPVLVTTDPADVIAFLNRDPETAWTRHVTTERRDRQVWGGWSRIDGLNGDLWLMDLGAD